MPRRNLSGFLPFYLKISNIRLARPVVFFLHLKRNACQESLQIVKRRLVRSISRKTQAERMSREVGREGKPKRSISESPAPSRAWIFRYKPGVGLVYELHSLNLNMSGFFVINADLKNFNDVPLSDRLMNKESIWYGSGNIKKG
ncbi:MAG: hypothetical protein JRI95_07740 [Deltaproteobacteria bacterium]|nr:hypothetical protein [Deltaproteobacteria bacterium]